MSEMSSHSACGCCGGVTALTPAAVENRPGLSALAFRAGTHARFKKSMLARLSSLRYLGELTTRDDSDPTVALLDAWATVLDVLTFYQERIANEGYLRTATERRSILELARTIGYELGPGVAASTWLAFTLDDSPGSPREVAIPAGTRAQSLPTKIELPQSFETAEEIRARAEWNALRPALTEPQKIGPGAREALLTGAGLDLKPGDALLWMTGTDAWDFQTLTQVEARPTEGGTRVVWARGLENIKKDGDLRVYILRQRAALFGHNAPDWKALPLETKKGYMESLPVRKHKSLGSEWPGFAVPNEAALELDAEYPRIVVGSWMVLAGVSGGPQLFKVQDTASVSEAQFALSTRRTRLSLDSAIGTVKRRQGVVFAQSEELFLAERPVGDPVALSTVRLDRQVEGLVAGRTVIVRGRRARVQVGPGPLQMQPADGSAEVRLAPGETLVVLSLPSLSGPEQVWHLLRDDGVEGRVLTPILFQAAGVAAGASGFVAGEESREAALASELRIGSARLRIDRLEDLLPDIFHGGSRRPGGRRPRPDADIPPRPEEIPTVPLALAPAEEGDPVVSEVAVLKSAVSSGRETTLTLEKPLANVYDPPTVMVHANVVKASHGETKREVLGSGDAAQRFQRFRLRQKPLTYVAAPVPGGGASTLELRVNGVRWREAPDLLRLGPRDRAYVLRRDDEGNTTVQLGDGVHGARPASGVENIEAVYRVGIGSPGAVGEDRITLLATRPLGVRGVTNPVAATGAGDPQERDQARRNAPRTVLTLDRAVSLRDFEDFARGFSGIGKAQARLLWKRGQRTVHLTVAAADGRPIARDAELFVNLLASLEGARDPHQALEVASFEPMSFKVRARLGVHPDYRKEDVLARAGTALRAAFSFEVRDFGQGVALSEVMSVLQRVDGVEGVDVEALHLAAAPVSLQPRLAALPARIEDGGTTRPGQILTLAPEPQILEVMR